MKNSPRLFFRAWRPAVLVVSLGLIAYLLYFHNIAHLLPGYDARELRTYQGASNWHNIVHNPINAPYKIFIWLGVILGHHSVLLARLVAASYGVLAALVFFMIARPWYGFRVAFLATVMFATSAGLLHVARLGSAEVLQMSVLVFMSAVLWYRRLLHRQLLVSYAVVASLALLWYVPGMLWFELFGLILLRQGALNQLRHTTWTHKLAWVFLFLALISPLILASVKTPALGLDIAGFPHNVHALTHTATNAVNTVLSIGVRSPNNPELHVGHAPLLNIVELVLGLIGAYYYLRQKPTVRSAFLVGSLLLSLILVSLGGAVALVSSLPVLYLFIAAGVNTLLSQWLSVFPRNPIARFTGLALVCVMLFFSVLYQVRSYFVAWPHNTITRQTFDHPEP